MTAAAFATTHDLADALGDEGRSVALERATDLIRAEVGQLIFPPVRETVILLGAGRRILQMPQIPVTAVHSVTVLGQPLLSGVNWAWATGGKITRLFAHWAAGVPVTIDYTHGYAEVPAELTRMCAALADKVLAGTIELRQISETLGARSRQVTYARASDDVFTTADQKILDHYRPELVP